MRSWGFVLLCWRRELEGSQQVCYRRRDSLTGDRWSQLTVPLHQLNPLSVKVASEEHYTGHQLCLTQVTLSIDPELVVRLCTSERQEIPLDLAEPDAVDRIRTPIATTAHAHNQSTTA